jgi:drug/metabolite transporter (DMT)-like permease
MKLGYFVLFLAQMVLGINVVTTKYLIALYPMFLLLTFRFFISSILLLAALVLSKTPFTDPRHPDGKLNANDWFLGVLQGVFAAFLFNLFFVWGLQHTTATAAGIVSSALPALIALFAVWFLKEKMTVAKSISLLLASLGILIINLDYSSTSTISAHSYFGDFLVLLAMVPEAWYSILSRKLSNRMTPLAAALIANFVGFITLLPCAIVEGPLDFSIFSEAQDCGLLMLGATCSLFFFWAWGWGLSFITAATAAIFGGVLPVSISILAVGFLGETLCWYDIVGICLVCISLIVGTGYKPKFLQKTDLVT